MKERRNKMDFNKDEVMVILAALRNYRERFRGYWYDPVYLNADAKSKADLDNQAHETGNIIRRIQHKMLLDKEDED